MEPLQGGVEEPVWKPMRGSEGWCVISRRACVRVEKVCRLRVVCNFKGVEKVCRLWGAALVPRSYQCTGDGYRELGVGM